jgi:FtsH-binding integral membrane protein
MGTMSVNRLAGLSLIFGPLIAFVFFLIEPGGLFIDNVKVSDAAGTIAAKGSNEALTNITNIAIILGLALILSGLYALMRNVTLQGNGKALVQMGFFMTFVGVAGWILSGGVDFILADAQSPEQIAGSVPVYYVGSALFYAGGITLGFGGFIFALGLSTRDDFSRMISLLAALVSLALMVFFMLAVLSNDGRDTFISLARSLYVLLVIWYGYLGVGLMKRPDPELWQ